MIDFFNNYHQMYSQRYFRKEGLIYAGVECESYRQPRNPITWRPKKDINWITPVIYYQNGMKKLINEERYLKENLGRNKMRGTESIQYVESSMEYDFFILSKNTPS